MGQRKRDQLDVEIGVPLASVELDLARGGIGIGEGRSATNFFSPPLIPFRRALRS
jgi:hypothetical protein